MKEAGLLARKLMNVDEAAHYVRLSKNTLYKMVSEKRIPHTKLGGRLMFPIALLDEWIKQNTVLPMLSKTG